MAALLTPLRQNLPDPNARQDEKVPLSRFGEFQKIDNPQ
jgi:hypothetical protein